MARRFENRNTGLKCNNCNLDLTSEDFGLNDVSIYDYKFFIGNCKKCGYGLVAKKAQRQAKFVSIGIIVSVILFLFLSFRY